MAKEIAEVKPGKTEGALGNARAECTTHWAGDDKVIPPRLVYCKKHSALSPMSTPGHSPTSPTADLTLVVVCVGCGGGKQWALPSFVGPSFAEIDKLMQPLFIA